MKCEGEKKKKEKNKHEELKTGEKREKNVHGTRSDRDKEETIGPIGENERARKRKRERKDTRVSLEGPHQSRCTLA